MALAIAAKYFMGILDDGQIELRKTKVVTDDEGETYERHHREVLEPGQDVSTYPPRVRALCNLIWTPAVITAYVAAKAARHF